MQPTRSAICTVACSMICNLSRMHQLDKMLYFTKQITTKCLRCNSIRQKGLSEEEGMIKGIAHNNLRSKELLITIYNEISSCSVLGLFLNHIHVHHNSFIRQCTSFIAGKTPKNTHLQAKNSGMNKRNAFSQIKSSKDQPTIFHKISAS